MVGRIASKPLYCAKGHFSVQTLQTLSISLSPMSKPSQWWVSYLCRIRWTFCFLTYPISQVRQTWNVDVRVAVDVQSHPAGYTTDKNTIFVFVGWTKTLYLLQYYYFVLLKNIRKMFFSNQTQNILKTNSSTLWSICPQGVKFYAYAHVYVYVSCLPNLPIGSGHGPLQTDDLWVNKRTNKDAGMLPTIRGWWYAFLSAKLIS